MPAPVHFPIAESGSVVLFQLFCPISVFVYVGFIPRLLRAHPSACAFPSGFLYAVGKLFEPFGGIPFERGEARGVEFHSAKIGIGWRVNVLRNIPRIVHYEVQVFAYGGITYVYPVLVFSFTEHVFLVHGFARRVAAGVTNHVSLQVPCAEIVGCGRRRVGHEVVLVLCHRGRQLHSAAQRCNGHCFNLHEIRDL